MQYVCTWGHKCLFMPFRSFSCLLFIPSHAFSDTNASLGVLRHLCFVRTYLIGDIASREIFKYQYLLAHSSDMLTNDITMYHHLNSNIELLIWHMALADENN